MQKFNLVDDPWIKVVRKSNFQEETVSLKELFSNIDDFYDLAGELKIQDVVVLRFLLAILTTAYSRKDFNGEEYRWIKKLEAGEKVNDKELVNTWSELFNNKSFSNVVTEYLEEHKDQFDFFGEHPFYQVSKKVYNSLVPDNKKINTGKGTVSVKQINRRISESNNTPAVFSPSFGAQKNKLSLDELVRWVITYQNISGVTDKTKLKHTDKYSSSAGWLYGLNPVYIKGKDLFETLILNLDLSHTVIQRPVWEWSIEDYIKQRLNGIMPDNIPELYTLWSRVLHIEWTEENEPVIFSAGLPAPESVNAYLEPMTNWKAIKKTTDFRPAKRSKLTLNRQIWRDFGDYIPSVKASGSSKPIGVVYWFKSLEGKGLEGKGIERLGEMPITLVNTSMVSDGNATSQAPYAEVTGKMTINGSILNDEDDWPEKIEQMVTLTQKIGSDYWYFLKNLGTIAGLKDAAGEVANKESAEFYARLNEPFLTWLGDIKAGDNVIQKINEWKETLLRIVLDSAKERFSKAAGKEIKGSKPDKSDDKKEAENVFTIYLKFKGIVYKHLEIERKKNGNS